MQPDAETLLLLSYHLRKPIIYFYPKNLLPELEAGELTEAEKSLLMEAKQLDEDDLKKLIAQVRAVAQMYNREDNIEKTS